MVTYKKLSEVPEKLLNSNESIDVTECEESAKIVGMAKLLWQGSIINVVIANIELKFHMSEFVASAWFSNKSGTGCIYKTHALASPEAALKELHWRLKGVAERHIEHLQSFF